MNYVWKSPDILYGKTPGDAGGCAIFPIKPLCPVIINLHVKEAPEGCQKYSEDKCPHRAPNTYEAFQAYKSRSGPGLFVPSLHLDKFHFDLSASHQTQ